jgi:iron complex outermembrane recepter protein
MSSRLIALPLFALPLISSLSFADTSTEANTIVVTATRLGELLSLPANITVITAEDIKNSPSRTLPELLAQEVGVNTTSLYSHGSRVSVGLRGFGETSTQNTLILLDGRRLNDIDLSAVNFSAIPFENIERIEIVRGSGAVLYGDGATGGTINIITKDPRDTQTYTKLSASTGSFDHREANLFTAYSGEKFGLTANINSIENNDGYRDHNSFEQNNGQIDLRVPTAKGEVYVKLGAFEQDMELPGIRLVDPTLGINQLKTDRKGTSTPNDWADEDTEFITLGYSADFNESDSFVVDSGYRHKQQHSQFDYGFGFGDYTDTLLETFSLTPRLNLERTVANLPVSWTLGADFYLYDYSSDRANFEINSNQPIHKIDVDQRSVALYGQGLVSVSDNTTLNLGWRTQRVRQEARDQYDPTAPGGAFGSEAADFNETDQENSFELGAKHLINDNWDVFGRIGRSVRFGTVDELFEFNSMFQQVFSELKPQVSEDIELGVNYGNDWLGLTLAVFQQDIEDEIHFNPVTFQNINFDETRHQGAEISLNAQITSSFSLKAGYTYLNAEFTEGVNDGNDIPLTPEHTYNVSAHVNLPSDFKGAISWNYVGESFFANDLSNTFGKKIPSYQTVDLKLSKKIANFELALRVNNLFDEKYYNFAVNSAATPGRFNAYPLPERNAYFTVSYEFD